MRNQFLSVTPTYRSEIIIKSNWYTLLNILVFDFGSFKLPHICSLVSQRLAVQQYVNQDISLLPGFYPKDVPMATTYT